MRKCNLIIDTPCDLPQEIINVDGIVLVRFPYILDGASHEDDMFTAQSPHEFYELIRNGKEPSTSQPSLQTLTKAFEEAEKMGLPAVYLCFTSALSGTFDSATMLAEQFKEKHPDFDLRVVNTKLPSIAEGLLVQEAINQMNQGLTADEMVSWVDEAHNYVDALFMVEDLESLKRGGRIPSSVAVAGSALDVKPLLTLNLEGGLKIAGIARGRKKGIRQLAKYFEDNAANHAQGGFVVVGDADCKKDGDKLCDFLTKVDESLIITRANIGPVIGSHVGPGMLAVTFWSDDRREKMSISDKISRKVKGN